MSAFPLKQHDTLPALEAVLSDDDGPIDLSGASVQFVLSRVGCGGREPVFKKPATLADAAAGKVRYLWENSDTADAGSFAGEFEVSQGGKTQTFPSVGYIPIIINPDLG
jgi:hypothetical protein